MVHARKALCDGGLVDMQGVSNGSKVLINGRRRNAILASAVDLLPMQFDVRSASCANKFAGAAANTVSATLPPGLSAFDLGPKALTLPLSTTLHNVDSRSRTLHLGLWSRTTLEFGLRLDR